MKKNVSEIIFETLCDLGVTDCFCVVGGGAMHLNHALGTNEGIKTHFNHHEQACAMAAEAYARYKGKPAIACVTSGPGATNAITGVMGAWVDSLPMIVISGNVRSNVSISSTGLPLRYRGIQEFDIINSVQNMTKYAIELLDPKQAKAEIIKAYEIAMNGRRGPVWIDVPLDIQNALVDTDDLVEAEKSIASPSLTQEEVTSIITALGSAERPCILFGSGISTAHLHEEFSDFLTKVQVPVVGGAWLGDVVSLDHDLYFGSSGNVGPRTGNFILESADLILVLGNSLSYKQTGYNLEKFAPSAKIIMVDVDSNEALKLEGKVDSFVQADLRDFFMLARDLQFETSAPEIWMNHCRALRERFSPYEGAIGVDSKDRVNKYYFWELFNKLAPDDTVLVLGNSQVGLAINQIGKAKSKQRMIANYICGSMGYDLPAAIGTYYAAQKPVVCGTGDGSFMMNLQELETISHNHLPIRIVLFENGGYGGIRQSQSNYFGNFAFGSDPESGVGFPNFEEITKAFGIEYAQCSSNEEVEKSLQWLFSQDKPVLLEVKETYDDPVVPKLISKLDEEGNLTEPLLCDLSPFVDDETLQWALGEGIFNKDR